MMMRVVNWARRAVGRVRQRVRRERERWAPTWQLRVVAGDAIPTQLPRRVLVLLRDDEEDWSVGMRCPCGCGETIELMLISEAKPRWDLSVDAKRRPSLHPSVWRKTGCCSHSGFEPAVSPGAIRYDGAKPPGIASDYMRARRGL